MFYISDRLSYNQVNIAADDIECVWLNLEINNRKYIVGNICRPPRSDTAYLDQMLDLIEQVVSLSENVVLLGDLNYDYKLDTTLATNPVHGIETMFDMKQLVKTPTRITTTSSTLLDVILSK